MASSSSPPNKAMPSDTKNQDQDQDQDRHPLNCPRCDSSNTKFCYYNNYSLSQPRHFCKSCKRYWTRGGTLRNVPVGGGCRKNKRPKRHSDGISSSSANPSIPPQMNVQSPLFYGQLAANPLELSFPFSISSDAAGFDLQPRINGLGLGFSSIHDGVSNSSASSPFSTSGNNSIFFFGSSSSSSTMESLLASNLQQQENITIPSLMPWNPNPDPDPTPMGRINSTDPSSLVRNTTSNGALFPSLI